MPLTASQRDRAIGAVLASAAGDALGSQYEFGPALDDAVTPVFGVGQFGHGVGEWTDDTSMAVPILDVLARIPQPFTEADVLAASRAEHERAGRSGGNGALMRTGPLALGYLDRPATELAAAANAISKLTHWEQDSASACILWSAAIRHAILTGKLDVRGQRSLLPAADAARWVALIDEALAPGAHPLDFMAQNGWVVRAFQGALAAVAGGAGGGCWGWLAGGYGGARRAGRGGYGYGCRDRGALGGAVWGASALPAEWVRGLHGWPGYSAGI